MNHCTSQFKHNYSASFVNWESTADGSNLANGCITGWNKILTFAISSIYKKRIHPNTQKCNIRNRSNEKSHYMKKKVTNNPPQCYIKRIRKIIENSAAVGGGIR